MSKYLKTISFSLFFIISIGSAYGQSCSEKFNVHRRKAHDKKVKVYRTCLSSLENKAHFETPFFKVVEGISNDAISLQHPLRDKAATALYHLERARSFYVNAFGPDSLSHLSQLTIRLEITRGFTDVAQFMSETKSPQYNNAVTIPPSGKNRITKYPEWNHEIWFRPAKKVEVSNQFTSMAELMESGGMQESAAVAIASFSAMDLIQDIASSQIQNTNPLHHLQTLGVSLGLLYILPKIFFVTGKVVKKYAYLDSVLIPEIIYHEFAHAAFSDSLSPRTSTPVIEGVANFFATQVAGGHRIAHRTGPRQQGYASRDGSKDSWYQIGYEKNAMAQSNFVFRLLFATQETLGAELGTRVVYEAAKSLDEGADIKYDLIEAIFSQTRKYFDQRSLPRVYLQLNKTFTEFGL